MQREVTFGPGNLLIGEHCYPHHFRYDNVSFHCTLSMRFPSAILTFRHASTATRVTQKPLQIIIPQTWVSCKTPLKTVHHFQSLLIYSGEARKKFLFKCAKLLTKTVKWVLSPKVSTQVTHFLWVSPVWKLLLHYKVHLLINDMPSGEKS